MTDIKARFEQAAADVHLLPERPDNQILLRLYGLYKQATEGDASGPRPGFFDFIGSAKHEAWETLAGMSAEDAMQAYIDLVEELRA